MNDIIEADRIKSNVTYDRIYRLRFDRGLRPWYLAGSQCSCDVILCSEFSDQLIDFKDIPIPLSKLKAGYSCIPPVSDSIMTCMNLVLKPLSSNRVRLSFIVPDLPGSYYFSFSFINDEMNHNPFPCDEIVLSLFSDVVVIHPPRMEPMSAPLPMLTNYRCLDIGGIILRVKEEYGSTIGSHLYDSGIVAAKYFQTKPLDLLSCDNVLELGAGCGITGMWLAKRFGCNVKLTDLKNQLPLLEANLSANELTNFCQSMAFDWVEDVQRLDGDFLHRLKLVVAADVLYDLHAALSLLHLLEGILNHSDSLVVLAQKNRNGQSVEQVHSILSNLVPSLRYECVGIEADVFLWSIFKRDMI